MLTLDEALALANERHNWDSSDHEVVQTLVREIEQLRTAVIHYLAVDDNLASMDCSDPGHTCLTNEDAFLQEEAIDALRKAVGLS